VEVLAKAATLLAARVIVVADLEVHIQEAAALADREVQVAQTQEAVDQAEVEDNDVNI